LAAEKTPKKNEMDRAVAHMGDRRCVHRGLRGVLRERDYMDDLSVDELYLNGSSRSRIGRPGPD